MLVEGVTTRIARVMDAARGLALGDLERRVPVEDEEDASPGFLDPSMIDEDHLVLDDEDMADFFAEVMDKLGGAMGGGGPFGDNNPASLFTELEGFPVVVALERHDRRERGHSFLGLP